MEANVSFINSQLSKPSKQGPRFLLIKLDNELWQALSEKQQEEVLEQCAIRWGSAEIFHAPLGGYQIRLGSH
ncbi:hypothetical protein KJ758_00160 [Patescibacteria group bacterium]|nr:hypothetical protein [Patescibacteria group bacterium]